MGDQAHRGARAPGPLTQTADRTVGELNDALRVVESVCGAVPLFGFMRDMLRTGQGVRDRPGQHGRYDRGTVIHALPHLNWYKVQCGPQHGWVAACRLDHCGLVPLGPRETGVLPPNTQVLLHFPEGLGHAQIVGVIPPALEDGSIAVPDWVVQGGGSGLKREAAHKFPLTGMWSQGGVIDWSANRPLDETAFMTGWVGATGLAVTVDDAMIQVRVNEMCGLFMTLYDSWCRLAGVQLDVESGVHEESARDDEGEARLFRGVAAYPWEALGMYAQGTKFVREYPDGDVQYTRHKGKVDLPDGAEDVQPVYRYQEYGGYLGQGHLRLVMRPGLEQGLRQLQPELPDEGLFRESVGLDGTYSLVFAKRGYIGKRCKIVVPKQLRLPEDGRGDDAAAGNYSFSGLFGDGPGHKVGGIRAAGADAHLRKVAAVQDVIAYVVNWQALHPFHYHREDFKTWQESETTHFGRVQEKLDYSVLEDEHWLPAPEPVRLKIDHRYGEVDYFERESFLVFQDDGSVQIGGGCGEQIVLAGGGIRLECPAGVSLLAGTDVLVRGAQVSVNSHGSMDFSSARGDQRFKAERNQHFLSGNSGTGGTLLESRGRGHAQRYRGRLGEDVISSGVVVKATDGVCTLLGQDVYLRSDGGDVTVDANAGRNDVLLYGRQVELFAGEGFGINVGPADDVSEVKRVCRFGGGECVIDSGLLLNGRLESVGAGGVHVSGDVYATGSVVCGGGMSDGRGGFVGKTPAATAERRKADLDGRLGFLADLRVSGGRVHSVAIVDKFYQPDLVGDRDTIDLIQFSFRDDPNGDQYRVANLKFPESHWMMLARFGLASGGHDWDEPPVLCQGEETYPWPGRKKWLEDACFLRLGKLGLFDPDAGIDRDRPGPYEDYSVPEFEPTTMAAGFKVNRQ